MKQFLLVFLFLFLLLVLVPATVVAQTNSVASSERCSLATLHGAYGVLEQGTILTQIPGFPPPPYAVVLAANATYDGAGNLAGPFKLSIGGVPLTGTFTGTYTVGSDCSYSEEFVATPPGATLHDSGVITGSGTFREIHYIYTDTDRIISGTAKKIPPGGCSLKTLKGDHAVFGQGAIFPPGFPPVFVNHVGTFTADGAGHIAGREDAREGGAASHENVFTADAAVDPNCTVSVTIHNEEGLVVREWGAITGQGRFQEFNGIVTDPGWVLAESVKKQ